MKKERRICCGAAVAAILLTGLLALSGCDGAAAAITGTAEVINIAAIGGVTVPETDAEAPKLITETAQYTGTITWSGGNPATFAAKTTYTATIQLMPKAGYTLIGVPANFFTVAGTSLPASNIANLGVVTAIFPATGASDADPDQVTIADIPGVTAPATGAAPVTSIETAQYTGTVAWTPAVAAVFEAETVYTAAITLNARTGWTFEGLAVNFFNVAGAPSLTGTLGAGKTTTVTAGFPATGGGGEADETYTLTITQGTNGALSAWLGAPVTGEAITTGDEVAEDADVTLYAEPDAAYEFVRFVVNGAAHAKGAAGVTASGANYRYTFKMTEDTTVTAVFDSAVVADPLIFEWTSAAHPIDVPYIGSPWFGASVTADPDNCKVYPRVSSGFTFKNSEDEDEDVYFTVRNIYAGVTGHGFGFVETTVDGAIILANKNSDGNGPPGDGVIGSNPAWLIIGGGPDANDIQTNPAQHVEGVFDLSSGKYMLTIDYKDPVYTSGWIRVALSTNSTTLWNAGDSTTGSVFGNSQLISWGDDSELTDPGQIIAEIDSARWISGSDATVDAEEYLKTSFISIAVSGSTLTITGIRLERID